MAKKQTNEQSGAQAEAPKKSGAKFTPVKKLTVATLFGPIKVANLPPLTVVDGDKTVPNPEATEVKICRIAGVISNLEHGSSQYGPWTALKGEFAGTNYETGELFVGKTALIPGAMGEMIVTQVENGLREDAEFKLKFSVDIFVERSARKPDEKYEYIVRPVVQEEYQSPALALLTAGE